MRKLMIAVTMVGTALLFGFAVLPTAGAAPEDVCGGTKVDVENLPVTILGVAITLIDDNTAHFDIPEGSTVTICVKAGSENQGDGPETVVLTADANVDHSTGKDLSHVSVISVSVPSTTTIVPPPPPPTTTTTVVPPPPPPTTTTTVVPPPPPPTTTTVTTTTIRPPPPPPGTTTTTPPVTTTTTTAPPVPPPDNNPPNNPPPNNPPNNNPPTLNQPTGTAFTGPERVLPMGIVAGLLLLFGAGALYWARERALAEKQEEEMRALFGP